MGNFARFLLVGGFATALQYALYIAGVHAGVASIPVVSGAAFAISSVVNFLLSRCFTFRSSEPLLPSGMRFATLMISGLCINTLIVVATLELGLHYLACQVIATGVVLLWNFFFASRWVFPAEDREQSGPTEP